MELKMPNNRASAAAQVCARLSHPVIDSDGHWVEFGPQLNDYLKDIGGSKALDGFKSRPTEVWHLTIPLWERRERRLFRMQNSAKSPAGRSTSSPPTCSKSTRIA